MSGEPNVKACEDWLKTESNGTGFWRLRRARQATVSYIDAVRSLLTVVHPRVTAETSSYMPPIKAT